MISMRLLAGALLLGVAGGAVLSGHFFSAVSAREEADTYRQLDLFGNVFERVRRAYVEEVEDAALIEDAINGMLQSLDPHSAYLTPEDFVEMQVQTQGTFGGLGIEVTMDRGVVKVITPIDDTPAQRAGLLPGDYITHLDGVPIQGMTLSDAVDVMRGPVDTSILLTVVREGVAAPFDVPIVRDIITIRSVRSNREGNIAYIRLTTFREDVSGKIREEISELRGEIGAENVVGYVLDLRNNPGGLLDEAIAVADIFLDRGEIVSTRGRNPQDTERYNASEGDMIVGEPLVVLVNGGSASASEIVAAALQDHRRASILGTRSFGKGSVQTLVPLGDEGALRLTTALYYAPSGETIQAHGVEPDIEIEQPVENDFQARVTGETALPAYIQREEGEESEEGAGEETEEGEGAEDADGAAQEENGEDARPASGSASFVPFDKEDDIQLQRALELLRAMKRNSS